MRIPLIAIALAGLCGCPESSPPAKPAADVATAKPSATASAATTTASAPATAAATATASASAAPTAAPSAAASAPPKLTMPPLLDDEGKPLPQTEDEPSVEDPVFQDRMKRLWDAIVADDPEMVRDFFFPVEAYAQVKAIKKPERDWKYRLWKNFKRDIHNYHKRLGKHRDQATFDRLELRNKPGWMKPGKEGNKLGYFRVTRSFIHFKNHEGKKRRFDLTSMISWRGHWYVVHLHGFE